MFIRAYLRASTQEQDASRARAALISFVREQTGGRRAIAAFYTENVSGASLERPELMRLIGDASDGDILLVEQVDRLSRLPIEQWEQLKSVIRAKGLHIVSPELALTYGVLRGDDGAGGDDVARVVSRAMSDLMLDLFAVQARKDYEDRRRRQAEGIAAAMAEGKYRGGVRDEKRRGIVADMLGAGRSYTDIQNALGCSRTLIASVSREIKETEL